MSLEDIAVLGMTVVVDQTTVVPPTPAPPPPPPVVLAGVQATIVVTPPTGTKVAATALVHRDGDKIVVTAITVPAALATIADPGPVEVVMIATATKTKAEGVEVLRLGDLSEMIKATPKIPGAPPVDYPITFQCIVSDAGQVKAKAQ